MSGYFHAYYAPFRVGDRVEVLTGPEKGQTGVVTRLSDPEAFDADDTLYYVRLDSEEQECPRAFHYDDLALADD
jgi:transcription elongation factor